MRRSEFNLAMATEYGSAYAAVVQADLVLTALGNRTAAQALAAGVPPREVWLALCAETDVPRERWYGVGLPKPASAG
ncbi:DUF3046 domain-containing protein [Microterricola viridarii]|uniref:Signal transduction histidine kinase n=1 Tax=Microterricola viridarii TaxID=412690 RepID=A0A109QWX5_9MICO|nr:DUF3046 domain-containing protein [Microterricola viridarii]AMB58952.1 signal transduction histidine kinase [Microterricola viridarii]